MNYYTEIKNELINNEINRKVKNYSINKNDLNTYYNVGKLLFEAGKHYGESIIKEYSIKLTNEFGKGYSPTRLKYIRRFYEVSIKSPSVTDELSYTHYCELIWFDDLNKIEYYIKISVEQNLSVRQLRQRIKNKEYERLPEDTKSKIINKKESKVIDFVKNPIIIKNSNNYETISEKILQKLILEDIENFMKELGNSFCFIGSEYKIRIGKNFNYIDLLLFNIEYNCYVVIELKAVEFIPEFVSKLNFYISAVDEYLKSPQDNPTIGLLLCPTKSNEKVRFSLRGFSQPMGVAEYEIKQLIEEVQSALPSIEEKA